MSSDANAWLLRRQLSRDRQRNFTSRCPLRAARERRAEAEFLDFSRTMPERRHEHTSHSVLCRPQHRLVNAGAGNRLARLALIQRMVVVGGGEHVIAAFGLPTQVGVELVG